MDAAGSIQNDYQYDAFGQRIAGQENIPNRLRYNAQIEDDLTGLYYLRARYYNTGIGRFTQEDVIYNDGLNLYAYCSSNPVMYADPSGYAKNEPLCAKDGDTTRVRHYTNSKGLKGIKESGVIIAKDNNRVYLELANKKPLSIQQAEEKYQIKKGKGRNYVEFDVNSSLLEWIENPRYHTKELTVKGNVKIKNGKFFKRN